jgi:hypothetical protein
MAWGQTKGLLEARVIRHPCPRKTNAAIEPAIAVIEPEAEILPASLLGSPSFPQPAMAAAMPRSLTEQMWARWSQRRRSSERCDLHSRE